jgi:hypothetical protein
MKCELGAFSGATLPTIATVRAVAHRFNVAHPRIPRVLARVIALVVPAVADLPRCRPLVSVDSNATVRFDAVNLCSQKRKKKEKKHLI